MYSKEEAEKLKNYVIEALSKEVPNFSSNNFINNCQECQNAMGNIDITYKLQKSLDKLSTSINNLNNEIKNLKGIEVSYTTNTLETVINTQRIK